MYYYWAYGLTVKSEIAFPELYPVSNTQDIDLEILLGDIPERFATESKVINSVRKITEQEYFLVIPQVASYYAGFGDKIIINKEDSADWDSIRLFCLSNAFAAILYQRKLIPLHCSALIYKDQLVLIFGESRAGKSTTLGAMMNKGYQIFSDDVCVPVVDERSGQVWLYSSYPMLKYWRNTIEKLGIPSDELSRQIRPEMEKYGLYFHDNFITELRKPFLCFILGVSAEQQGVSVERINGMELFKKLEHHAYRGEQLGYANLKKIHFELFVKLANQCPTFNIERSSKRESIGDVADLIENIIKSVDNTNID